MNTPADSATPAQETSRPSRRRPHWGVVGVALVLTPLILKGYTDINDGLRAGSSTPASNTVHADSAAIGKNNTANGVQALAVGEANSVAGVDGNFATGKLNSINGYSNAAFGYSNAFGYNVLRSIA